MIGVIKDYTIDYSANEIEIIISGWTQSKILRSYQKYLGNYDKKLAEQAGRFASQYLRLSHNEFVSSLLSG